MRNLPKIPSGYKMPAEWHRQSGIQLAWPQAGMDWQPYLEEIRQTYLELIEAITPHEPVLLGTEDIKTTRQYLSTHLSEETLRQVKLAECPHNDTWARDFGMITLLNEEGQPLLLDFRFNGWGEKFHAELDNLSSERYFAQELLYGHRVDCLDLILEGGSIESDGHGTIFTTAQCLLAPNRNQPLTQNDIERELLYRLGARRIIWLHHGTLIGDDTDGHIDTTVRTAPNDTLLYVKCEDTADPQYEDFLALERELRQLRNLEGKPYRLIPLPMPKEIHFDGERLPATYANFLVINGAVIVPTYGQPDHDTLAMERVAEAFPGRQIVGVDAQIIVRQHGSIHCLTMQYPVGVLRI